MNARNLSGTIVALSLLCALVTSPAAAKMPSLQYINIAPLPGRELPSTRMATPMGRVHFRSTSPWPIPRNSVTWNLLRLMTAGTQ